MQAGESLAVLEPDSFAELLEGIADADGDNECSGDSDSNEERDAGETNGNADDGQKEETEEEVEHGGWSLRMRRASSAMQSMVAWVSWAL